jgi:catechol 2,3-dioxygenase-like lactoylglutathione lyase family enzyme
MSVLLSAISFEAREPVAVAQFWASLLGRDIVQETDGVLVPGDQSQVGLRFIDEPTERPERNRLHLHVTSDSLDEQRRIVERVESLGGRRRGSKPLQMGRDIYLTDPDGSEICVISPDNAYLAGCGILGEVTCDGSRAAALFWRDALEWTIVWDEDAQIAIQSPAGGTKIGWDDWSEGRGAGWNRQRFEVSASDPGSVEKLVALGATRIADPGGAIRMLDPDGSEFLVRPGPDGR